MMEQCVEFFWKKYTKMVVSYGGLLVSLEDSTIDKTSKFLHCHFQKA